MGLTPGIQTAGIQTAGIQTMFYKFNESGFQTKTPGIQTTAIQTAERSYHTMRVCQGCYEGE